MSKPLRNGWSEEDQQKAYAEGWGIFDNDERGVEIERLDDPQSVNESYPAEPVFESDEEAERWVETQAARGNWENDEQADRCRRACNEVAFARESK